MLSMVFIGQMFFSLAFIRRKRLIVFMAITLLLLNRPSFAQDMPNSNYHRLNIGDTVPDISFTVCNFAMPSAKLSDFSGKLVILDFWATWCGSCIKMFPKADSLQKKFNDKAVFILVNSSKSTQDSARQLNAFFERWQKEKGKPFPLITASNDTAAFRCFPHIFLPHYVWIGADRIVLAITGSKEVTAANIKLALQNRRLNVPVKSDRYSKDD